MGARPRCRPPWRTARWMLPNPKEGPTITAPGQPVMSRNGTGITDTARTPIRCLVVDDHPAILAGLRGLLSSETVLEGVEALVTAEAAAEVAERTPVYGA